MVLSHVDMPLSGYLSGVVNDSHTGEAKPLPRAKTENDKNEFGKDSITNEKSALYRKPEKTSDETPAKPCPKAVRARQACQKEYEQKIKDQNAEHSKQIAALSRQISALTERLRLSSFG